MLSSAQGDRRRPARRRVNCATIKVTNVTAKRGTVAEKYRINAGFGDKTFTRNDLQKVIGEVEKAPGLKRAPTRSEKAKEAVEGRRVTRLFYGCSYMFHLSGNNRRNSHFMGS